MSYEESYGDLMVAPEPYAEFVPVAFTATLEQAVECKQLLEQHNVPALVDDERGGESMYTALARGVPVRVPAQMHERATDLLHEEFQQDWRGVPLMAADDDDEDLDVIDDDDDDEDDDFDDDFDDLDDDLDDDDDDLDDDFDDED